jgi:tetratricopeptide (TPR) repeat protein
MNPPEDPSTPSRIGPYKVLQLLGEGGMGEVFLAEQTKPVSRQVAVKVIKLGMDTKVVLARFEAERQALAIMDHPSIAKVLDAGTTDDGRPYFVMEFVPGIPITDYCDMHKLSTGERLELFIQLCGAVQHAHQKGVIHRDLKPSNVLVTVPNGHPAPKVIDFGIVKAMGYKLTDLTLHTQQGQPIGTPAYMSPEQAEMTGLDVDTRTDVYTLGVMLYELLVGTVPIDIRQVPATALSMALRETDPPKPSARFSTLGNHQTRIAELRQTDPGALRSRVRGDLDWIVMKAMEKDRTRRYETVNELAQDIRRHLNFEPVLAAAPSAAYRVRKFARRHRVGVFAGVAVAAGLVGGSILATMGLLRARAAEAEAATQAATAREALTFMETAFDVSDPNSPGSGATAREILDNGAERIRTEMTGDPLSRAQLLSSIGNAYTNLGELDEARPLLEEALTLRRIALGQEHPDVARGLNDLGVLYYRQGRYPEADSLYRQALAIAERAFGPDHGDVASKLNNLAVSLSSQGRNDEALPLLERTISIWQEELGPDDMRLARALNNLAEVHREQGTLEEAEALQVRALSIRERVYGPDHPDLAASLHNLANLYRDQGRYDDAEPLYRRSRMIWEDHLSQNHPTLASSYFAAAESYRRQGRHAEAEPLYQLSLASDEARLGSDDPLVIETVTRLAHVYREQGKFGPAESLYERAVTGLDGRLGQEARLAEALEGHATLLRATDRNARADALDDRVRELRAEVASEG